MKTMQQVSPVNSVPETNLSSSLSFNQLEQVLQNENNAAGFPVAIDIREDS